MDTVIKPVKSGVLLVVYVEHENELHTFTRKYSSISSASLGAEQFVSEVSAELTL